MVTDSAEGTFLSPETYGEVEKVHSTTNVWARRGG